MATACHESVFLGQGLFFSPAPKAITGSELDAMAQLRVAQRGASPAVAMGGRMKAEGPGRLNIRPFMRHWTSDSLTLRFVSFGDQRCLSIESGMGGEVPDCGRKLSSEFNHRMLESCCKCKTR
ncbi:unnamed protein product [Ostreobium quekettii]|uniref:Uncharacterized protein n=1 Tax=Ostreobium quekettii TaxID=121088 RepID=A0A8S1JA99_9CHLO|nr:unnamed protein product [Ostreobium quekettii]